MTLSEQVEATITELVEGFRSTGEWSEARMAGSLGELSAILSHAETVKQAAQRVVDSVKAEMQVRIGEGRAYRYGPTIFRVKPKTTTRVVDPGGLAGFLGSDVSRVFRLAGSNLRVTQLRAVAEEREVSLNSIYGTFLEVEDGETRLESLPVDKAPKFLRSLADGEMFSDGEAFPVD